MAAADSSADGTPAAHVSNALLTFLSQTAVAAALLLYVGYVYVDATYKYFGLYASTLGLGPSDVALRSVSGLVNPLFIVLLVMLLVLIADASLVRQSSDPIQRRVALTSVVVGSCMAPVGIVLVAIFLNEGAGVLGAAIASTGFALIAFQVRRLENTVSHGTYKSAAVVSYLLASLTFVVAASSYGALAGTHRAQEAANNLSILPSAVIVSEKDLMLSGPGIIRTVLPTAIKYEGLRLLLRSGDRSFLLPQNWRRGTDRVIVLKDTDTVRLEIGSGADA